MICTLTPASEPVLRGDWVKPGAHVNAVGACTPQMREIDEALLLRCSLFADARESCLKEPGDVVVPLREGKISEDHVKAELGELLTGRHGGRTADDEVTLFQSLGLAVEDLAAALHIYKKHQAKAAAAAAEQTGDGGGGAAPAAKVATVALNPTT